MGVPLSFFFATIFSYDSFERLCRSVRLLPVTQPLNRLPVRAAKDNMAGPTRELLQGPDEAQLVQIRPTVHGQRWRQAVVRFLLSEIVVFPRSSGEIPPYDLFLL